MSYMSITSQSSLTPESSASNRSVQWGLAPPTVLVPGYSKLTAEQQYRICLEYYKACQVVDVVGDAGRTDASSVVSSQCSGFARTSSVASDATGVSSLQSGACYLRVVRRECRDRVFLELGMCPTFSQLLDVPRSFFLPDSVLKKVRVDYQGDGLHHLSDVGSYDFFQAASHLSGSSKRIPASLAGVLSKRTNSFIDLVSDIQLSHKLGLRTTAYKGEVDYYPYVYLKLIKSLDSISLEARKKLGPNPTFRQLMACPVGWFRTRQELVDTYVVLTIDGVCGVGSSSAANGISWLRLVRRLCRDVELEEGDVGSMAYAMKNSSPLPDSEYEAFFGWSLDFTLGTYGECGEHGSVSLGPKSESDSGYCYLAMILSDYSDIAALLLGPGPTVARLISCPSDWFVPLGGGHQFIVEKAQRIGWLHVCRSELDSGGEMSRSEVCSSLGFKGVKEFLMHGLNRLSAEPSCELRVGSPVEGHSSSGGVSLQQGVTDMRQWLAKVLGVSGAAVDNDAVYLLSKSAAGHSSSDKARLKMYEVLGDSVITTFLARKCCRESRRAQEFQDARSALTSNSALTGVYSRTVPDGIIQFPSGVNPKVGNVGAYVIEAVVGVAYSTLGDAGVVSAIGSLQLFEGYRW